MIANVIIKIIKLNLVWWWHSPVIPEGYTSTQELGVSLSNLVRGGGS